VIVIINIKFYLKSKCKVTI